MKHYCTYFDQHYLTRGLALHHSLVQHAGDFELTVLCMDQECEATLRQRALPHVRLLPVAELTALHPALAAARSDRTKLEFYFTCTAWLMRNLLPQIPVGELLTYLDADLYFFSSPQPVYKEIGHASVAITPHRFPASLVHLERYGKFNVGWVSFRHDATGQACAADWADRCAAWCFNRLEDDRYADQKYLDAWEARFPGTVSLQHLGVNAAPWNIKDAVVTAGPRINGQPLVFYHFHSLVHLGRQLHDPSLHRYDADMTPSLREHVYRPYLLQLISHEGAHTADDPDVLPLSRVDDPRSGLAVPHLLARLRASELDRAQRLSSIEENMAATKQTISYLKIVETDRDKRLAALEAALENTQRMEAYILSIEKDREERGASIHVYQEKLKQAYADHAHNVAYIERLHGEIAAHVKVADDHNRIIAELNEKLRATLAGR